MQRSIEGGSGGGVRVERHLVKASGVPRVAFPVATAVRDLVEAAAGLVE